MADKYMIFWPAGVASARFVSEHETLADAEEAIERLNADIGGHFMRPNLATATYDEAMAVLRDANAKVQPVPSGVYHSALARVRALKAMSEQERQKEHARHMEQEAANVKAALASVLSAIDKDDVSDAIFDRVGEVVIDRSEAQPISVWDWLDRRDEIQTKRRYRANRKQADTPTNEEGA